MKVCSKCNSKINFKTILKSTYKRDGLIECNMCGTKFKVKGYLAIVIILIILSSITISYLTTYYSTTLINNIIIGAITLIAVTFLYITLALLLPWKEQ
ncbi:hypothetical protein ACQPUY_07945 [Clostridium nigeriense]|uniref:hypothetical protein n=1 Tax=Clostridium nigeriense TaxID=1805470 RepID=UPI003D356EAF